MSEQVYLYWLCLFIIYIYNSIYIINLNKINNFKLLKTMIAIKSIEFLDFFQQKNEVIFSPQYIFFFSKKYIFLNNIIIVQYFWK